MNQTTDYTFGVASLEIVILLLGAFVLGMLLCWLLRAVGLCCRAEAMDDARERRQFPGAMGGYTADIDSLLREREEPPKQRKPFYKTAEPEPAPRPMATPVKPPPVAPVETAVAAPVAPPPSHGRKDDLKKLEGIGPKIESVLNAAGIQNFAQLAAMLPEDIKPILEAAGNQFRMHDPKSWPYQAELASKGEWQRLKEYQDILIGGQG